MRELRGSWSFGPGSSLATLKSKALIFDKIYIHGISSFTNPDDVLPKLRPHFENANDVLNDVEYLANAGLIDAFSFDQFSGYQELVDAGKLEVDSIEKALGNDMNWFSIYDRERAFDYTMNALIRLHAIAASKFFDVQVVPIFTGAYTFPAGIHANASSENVFTIALKEFPVPGESASWQDILDFRAHHHDKLWSFRRFLSDLSKKSQSANEVKDDLEWTLNEYSKEMDRFNLKRSASFMEAYVLPFVEAFESLRPSSFIRGLVAIQKRKIEMLEMESKAAGKECAYLFEAKKQFER